MVHAVVVTIGNQGANTDVDSEVENTMLSSSDQPYFQLSSEGSKKET